MKAWLKDLIGFRFFLCRVALEKQCKGGEGPCNEIELLSVGEMGFPCLGLKSLDELRFHETVEIGTFRALGECYRTIVRTVLHFFSRYITEIFEGSAKVLKYLAKNLVCIEVYLKTQWASRQEVGTTTVFLRVSGRILICFQWLKTAKRTFLNYVEHRFLKAHRVAVTGINGIKWNKKWF